MGNSNNNNNFWCKERGFGFRYVPFRFGEVSKSVSFFFFGRNVYRNGQISESRSRMTHKKKRMREWKEKHQAECENEILGTNRIIWAREEKRSWAKTIQGTETEHHYDRRKREKKSGNMKRNALHHCHCAVSVSELKYFGFVGFLLVVVFSFSIQSIWFG